MRPGQLLTAKHLETAGACDGAVQAFRRRWPKGVRLTRKVFRGVARSRSRTFGDALFWFRYHPEFFNQQQRDTFFSAWSGRPGREEADAMWEGLKAE